MVLNNSLFYEFTVLQLYSSTVGSSFERWFFACIPLLPLRMTPDLGYYATTLTTLDLYILLFLLLGYTPY